MAFLAGGGRDIVAEAVSEQFVQGLREEAREKADKKAEAAQRERKWEIQRVRQEKENTTGNHSDSDSDDDLLCDPELEDIRKNRMAKLMSKVQKKKKAAAEGCNGEYRMIQEADFLKEVCTTNKVVCHFYHNDFERCKIIDKHLALISKEHKEAIKVIKIDAEKAPFFVNKLAIRVLPTVVFFTNGVSCPPERMVGFDGLPNGDDFTTRDLEEILVRFEVIAEARFPEENVVVEVDGTKGDRIAGGGAVYGFNRQGLDSDDSDDEYFVTKTNTKGKYY